MMILAAILWAIVITLGVAMLRQSRIDAGMHPRRGEGEQERAAHRNPKFNRAVSPVGSVDHLNHNEGISRG